MRRERSRERSRSSFDREPKIKKVNAHKQLSRNWKRFLETEEFDEY
ncbi:MAG: hypothetical protein RLP15_07680 [Cryomorphaceae bacterium]